MYVLYGLYAQVWFKTRASLNIPVSVNNTYTLTANSCVWSFPSHFNSVLCKILHRFETHLLSSRSCRFCCFRCWIRQRITDSACYRPLLRPCVCGLLKWGRWRPSTTRSISATLMSPRSVWSLKSGVPCLTWTPFSSLCGEAPWGNTHTFVVAHMSCVYECKPHCADIIVSLFSLINAVILHSISHIQNRLNQGLLEYHLDLT